MIDLKAVMEEMGRLEATAAEHRDAEVPVGQMAAQYLGIEHSDELDTVLTSEALRTLALIRTYYRKYGINLDNDNVAALAFVQGITFARAVQNVKESKL